MKVKWELLPINVSIFRQQVASWLAMVNHLYLEKFSPKLAEISQPLRELLTFKHSWTDQRSDVLYNMKPELSKSIVFLISLANYKIVDKEIPEFKTNIYIYS